MLNYIWGFMILIGIATAAATGKNEALTEAVLNGGKGAVSLCVTMLGVVPLWSGIMRIAEKAGAIEGIKRLMEPALCIVFPTVPPKSKAMDYIAANLAANFLGLGWAATPPGLSAMKELKRLNGGKKEASDAMCMFMIINMSSVQLISVNLIAYRAEYLSLNPAEVTVPIIIATLVSTGAGIIYGFLARGR